MLSFLETLGNWVGVELVRGFREHTFASVSLKVLVCLVLVYGEAADG